MLSDDDSLGSRDNVYNMLRILTRQKSGLNIVHINAQSLHCKIDEFRYLFASAGVDIICISETWFPYDIHDSVYDLEGFRLFRSDRTVIVNGIDTKCKGGGVAVYVRCGIKSSVRLKSVAGSEIEYLFIEVTASREHRILVGSVYRPHRNLPVDPFINVLEGLSIQYADIVIVGDFNNNLLTGNPLIDPMLSLGLTPVNTVTPTHYHRQSCSLIDLVFVSNSSRVLLYDQLLAPCFSSHDLLFVSYDIYVDRQARYCTYRDVRRLDYSFLEQEMENIYWPRIYFLDDVNDQMSFLQANVNSLFDKCVPLRTKCINAGQQPWFSNRIKTLIIERNAAYARWKRFRTPELREIFRSCRREVVKSIRESKCLFYRGKFSSAMDSRSKWREIRKIGIGRNNSCSCEIDVNADDLNRKFLDVSIPQPTHNLYADLCYAPIEHTFSFRCVSQYEVMKSFSLIKSRAIGIDGVDPVFLGIILPRLLPFVTFLFNSILTKSIFPDGWKLSKIIPIPKPNGDYRPIAILPFLSKVMENIMSGQINDYLRQSNLLSDRQSGFVKGRSCITALTDVIENLSRDIDKGMVSFLVLLDHSKAFDSVDHAILVKKLEKFFYFSSGACKLLHDYLTGRFQTVALNGRYSVARGVKRGVPQGSILGPLLFCLYINDLPDVIEHCGMRMYADDVQIYRSCMVNDIHLCVDNLNIDLAGINKWAVNNGLCINPSKSCCIFINDNNITLSNDILINIDDDRIEFVSHCKNLGVVFNNRLSWSNHISTVAGRVYGMLRNLWAVKHSTPLEIRFLLAKTYLLPVLLYGCEIYSNCSASDFNKLRVAYNSIARYIYDIRPRRPISQFSYQINRMTFGNLLKFRTLIFLHRILTSLQPDYLFKVLKLGRSARGRTLIQLKYRRTSSQHQFFIHSISLWNQLPNHIRIISNANRFRNELLKYLS